MNLFFCGDIMPGGVLPYQEHFLSEDVKKYLASFDFRIGTLEAAIGTNLPYDEVKMKGRQNIVYARDEDFFRVKEMGFDVVSLANNHVWDLGEEGLKNIIRQLDENGILHCGAGMNAEEASKPVVLEKDGLSIAIFAYCMYGNPWLGYVELAGPNKPGINPLDIEKVASDIKIAKKQYDIVIVMPHWGMEYTYYPLPECKAMAKQMVVAGADAVLGSHPHHIQPIVNIKGKPVCFSMGNFLFPDFYMYPPRPIWYPSESDDLTQIQKVEAYPFPITEPMLQVWNKESRIGQCVALDVSSSQTKCSYQYLNMSKDNIVHFAQIDSRMKFLMWVAKMQLRSRVFSLVLRGARKIKRILNR